MLLDQQIHRMAAGGYDNIPLIFPEHALILGFYHGSAQGRFLHIRKAQLLQRLAHSFDAYAFVVGNKGRGQADDHRVAALQQHPHLFGAVYDLLGVLGADHKAMAAQNALVADNMSLVAGKANGLYGAMADALIAVFAVGLFQG